MNKLRNAFIILFISACIIISGFTAIIIGLPALIRTEYFCSKLEHIIHNKTGLDIDLDGLNLKLYSKKPAVLNIKNFIIYDRKNEAFKIQDTTVQINLKNITLQQIEIKKMETNIPHFQNALKTLKKSNKKTQINFSKLPNINIERTHITIDRQAKHKINFKNITMTSTKGIKEISFLADYTVPNSTKNITLGRKGRLYIQNNGIYANDFHLNSNNIDFYLNGTILAKDKTQNIFLKAQNIPVKTTMETLLYYQKLQDNNKKFIENFKDFDGTMDLKIYYATNQTITGKLDVTNLKAKSVLFDVPINFPKAVFVLKNNTITSNTEGFLGGEKVYHSLLVENLFSPKRLIIGKVNSILTERMISQYLPKDYRLKNSAKAKIIYKIQNKIPEVEYYLTLDKNSDVMYKDAYLGLQDKRRQLYAKTVKVINGLKLANYDYSLIEDSQRKTVILGEGLFIKQKGRLTPKYVTCKTNGYAPTSITGSFGRYVIGGEFKGNLKYDFITDKITGNFEIIRTIFNDFYVRSAQVIATIKGVDIIARGSYKHQNFNCEMRIDNRLDGIFIVHNMNIILEKFRFNRKHSDNHIEHKHQPKFVIDKIDDVSSKIRKIDMTIYNWNIKVNKLFFEDIAINNVELLGSLTNSIFKFSMPAVSFANGDLSAYGKYDFNNNSSVIDFIANNIDSNNFTTLLFKLPNQIQGIANARLHVHTYNNLQQIYAKAGFEIQDGFLPQFGNTQFMLGKANKKRKINIYEITNIDFTSKENLSSNIWGDFELDNYLLKNINIYMQQKYMSAYMNGTYDIQQQQAEINLYGKYDKDAPKGLRILFVPLNWILRIVFRPEETIDIYAEQLQQIPQIKTKKGRCQYFRVNVKGNLNTDDIKVILKRIK